MNSPIHIVEVLYDKLALVWMESKSLSLSLKKTHTNDDRTLVFGCDDGTVWRWDVVP